jgi:hypothetical protein
LPGSIFVSRGGSLVASAEALSFAACLAQAEEKPGTEADDAIRVLVFDSAD